MLNTINNLICKIFAKISGKCVGQDSFGNTYYLSHKKTREFNRKKRWIIYKAGNSFENIDPNWHNWLRYLTKEVPNKQYKIPTKKCCNTANVYDRQIKSYTPWYDSDTKA